ncbi:MAG: alpha/beta fold hydrolase [Saprospiraceae bacterium]|nr:alpha/beta fold hydrolase [Saprospiraceae bacterium]
MKHLIAILLLLFLHSSTFSQSAPKLINRQALLFQLQTPQDSISLILADTATTHTKPVLLFCQGSLPVPLFVEIESYGLYMLGGGIGNFDLPLLRQHYHVVVISMPHVPAIAGKNQVNPQFQFITDPNQPHSYPQAYVEADYLDRYVQRAITVLDFLKKQPWVDSSRLVVAGHSQGSKVASKIARQYPGVTQLGLFAANPFGRADQFIRQARTDAQSGVITWEKADSVMQEHYRFFETVHQPDSLAIHPEYKSWNTFSEWFFDDWLQLDIPIYLAYGTEDQISDLCDLIPLFFIKEGKQNLTLKRYLHLEHNFFPVNPNTRQPDYQKPHWPEVMNTFLNWTLK